jgi:hypothetical protein
MPEYNTQVNTYFIYYPEAKHHGFALCIDSIKPTKTFPVKTLITDYLIEDTNTFIYQSSGERFLKRVNTQGTILDTLHFGFLGTMHGDTLGLWAMSTLTLPFNKMEAKRCYYSHTSFTKIKYDMGNIETRRKILQLPRVQVIEVSKDSVTSTQQRFTHYPKAFFSEKVSYSGYNGTIAFNKNLDIVIAHADIDSIFVTHTKDNSQEHFPIKSRHKPKSIEWYDTKQAIDYTYIMQYACRSFNYCLLHYDSYRDYYYIKTSLPMPYENKDGTINHPIDAPWSLIIIDGQYKQIAEIDMPDYLNINQMMIVPQGIAIENKILTEEKGAPVYVIYKIEKK